MGAVSGFLGTAGGASGSGFEAPGWGGSPPINPFQAEAPGQIRNSYTSNQDALKSQQALLQALSAQNGIQNQSNVYNQLQGVVNGTGPNPAQAMLNQRTGENVANQAALMAGQRGANQNVGLLARQAAQAGAGAQQQAVGQGASMQAQQSLGALGQVGNLAGNQVSNLMGANSTNMQAQQNEQQMLLNALSGYNATNAGLQANINSSNAALTNTAMQGQQSLIGGVINGVASGIGMAAMAEGGEPEEAQQVSPVSGPQSSFGQFLKNWSSANSTAPTGQIMPEMSAQPGAQAMQNGSSNLANKLTKLIGSGSKSMPGTPVAGGPMDAGGPGAEASVIPRTAAGGGMMTHDYRGGGNVKAKNASQKAVASGNSYANDKIPAVLSEGEVVIPRSVMQSKDPVGASAKFVQDVMAKRKMRG